MRMFASWREVRELARVVPLALVLIGDGDYVELRVIDVDGVLWLIADGWRRELVRWSLDVGAIVFPGMQSMLVSMQAGSCVGLLASGPWSGPGLRLRQVAPRFVQDEPEAEILS